MAEPHPVDASDSVLVHIAQLFYERDMTKQDIANKLGISRFKVARLLDYARSEGIVRIEIRGSNLLDEPLSRQLEERFSLEKALVVVGDVETGYIVTPPAPENPPQRQRRQGPSVSPTHRLQSARLPQAMLRRMRSIAISAATAVTYAPPNQTRVSASMILVMRFDANIQNAGTMQKRKA